MSSLRSVSLNEVVVGSKPTHIVIYQDDQASYSQQPQHSSHLEAEVKELKERLAQLEKFIESLDSAPSRSQSVKPSPFFHAQISGPIGLEVHRLDEPPKAVVPVETVFETLVKSVRATPALVPQAAPLDKVDPADAEAEDAEAEDAEEGDADAEAAEEGEADAEAAEEGDAEEEEEEQEEAMELTEFEYKGNTYYRDSENQVYQKDEDGDLDDDPIGVWNEAKQKVLKYPKK